MYLFDLASRHMTWLSERQAVTASNIANADTPGYRAQAVSPFSSILENAGNGLAMTSPLHMSVSAEMGLGGTSSPNGSWASSHSGNSVSIEQELMNASAANRMMAMDASLERSFHRMFLTSVKA